ncbi:hypothetical protein BV20DRAFT_414325 [Pilatotrama ljubarskyi]|nr:hypothetical protein BV20DRAFT_414325 [Pilatotrama ljubarskyi]
MDKIHQQLGLYARADAIGLASSRFSEARGCQLPAGLRRIVVKSTRPRALASCCCLPGPALHSNIPAGICAASRYNQRHSREVFCQEHGNFNRRGPRPPVLVNPCTVCPSSWMRRLAT